MWQIPGVIVRVDGCYIPIKCLHSANKKPKKCYSFKSFYSIVMMSIAGADYNFLWVTVGLPDRVNDACTFPASHLYKDIVNGRVLPDVRKKILNKYK